MFSTSPLSPCCGANTKVKGSRNHNSRANSKLLSSQVRRNRECGQCRRLYVTIEVLEEDYRTQDLPPGVKDALRILKNADTIADKLRAVAAVVEIYQ